MRAEFPPHWLTAGEQRHVLLERRHDVDGRPYVVTGCGWLIWPSRRDARLPDPIRCQSCECVYGDDPAVMATSPVAQPSRAETSSRRRGAS